MSDYPDRVAEQVAEDLRDDDVTVDVVVLGGAVGETVSHRVAVAAQQGIWWGCWSCRALDYLVQWHHCQATLDPNATVPWTVYPRAAVSFAGVTALLVFAARWLALTLWGLL